MSIERLIQDIIQDVPIPKSKDARHRGIIVVLQKDDVVKEWAKENDVDILECLSTGLNVFLYKAEGPMFELSDNQPDMCWYGSFSEHQGLTFSSTLKWNFFDHHTKVPL